MPPDEVDQEKKFTYSFAEPQQINIDITPPKYKLIFFLIVFLYICNNRFKNVHKSQERIPDLYFELNESIINEYYDHIGDLHEGEELQKTRFSNFNDWSKTIQRAAMATEKLSENLKPNGNSIVDVFKAVLGLKERGWYEEIIQLYKVQLKMNY